METLDDKAFVMMLLHEADEKSLKIEALSLITECCTSSDSVDWSDIRNQLQSLIEAQAENAEAGHCDRKEPLEISFGESVGFPG